MMSRSKKEYARFKHLLANITINDAPHSRFMKSPLFFFRQSTFRTSSQLLLLPEMKETIQQSFGFMYYTLT